MVQLLTFCLQAIDKIKQLEDKLQSIPINTNNPSSFSDDAISTASKSTNNSSLDLEDSSNLTMNQVINKSKINDIDENSMDVQESNHEDKYVDTHKDAYIDIQSSNMAMKSNLSQSNSPIPNKEIRIWMDGAFDMMHYGHMNAFRQGKAVGTYLIVGVNNDESITQCKGEFIHYLSNL